MSQNYEGEHDNGELNLSDPAPAPITNENEQSIPQAETESEDGAVKKRIVTRKKPKKRVVAAAKENPEQQGE